MENMFGDILSDQDVKLVGGLYFGAKEVGVNDEGLRYNNAPFQLLWG